MNISEHFKNYNFLFDSHAHLSTGSYEDLTEILKHSEESGIKKIFDMGVDLKSSRKAIQLARDFPNVSAFIGIDPEAFEPGSEMFVGFDKKDEWFEEQYNSLKKIITENSEFIAGIGETGMDFYHFQNENNEIKIQSTQLQERLFKTHLEIAKEFKLPVSIHSRAAESYCLDIVKIFPEVTGIFHSYTGDYETAKKILDSGWGLGVNGIITFKNAEPLREMYRKILGKISQPPESLNFDPQLPSVAPQYFYSKGIFFETDSPYLAPEGKRGEQNEPANVKMIYDNFVKMLSL